MPTHARKRTSILANLGLAAVVGVLALTVAEIGIRLFVTVRNVGPPVSAYDPVYGVRLKRNFDGVQITPEFRMHITTNSLGFRGPEPVESPGGALLYLGDSFTVGFGVDDGQEFPALVAQHIIGTGSIPVPYINAGRGNSGQGHWVKFLRREAETLNPRVVVLQVLDNDFEDNIREALFRIGPADSLVELRVPPPGIERVVETVIGRLPFVAKSHLYGLVRQAYYELATARYADLESGGSRAEDETRLLLRLLDEVGRICETHGWPAVALRVALDSDRDLKVDSVLSAHGIRSARIPSRKLMPELYYEVDGHWNVDGHKYAADVVLRMLAETDLVLVGQIAPDRQ